MFLFLFTSSEGDEIDDIATPAPDIDIFAEPSDPKIRRARLLRLFQGRSRLQRLNIVNAHFGFNLYRSLRNDVNQTDNILLAPAGISIAMGMMSLGAGPGTHEQLYNALGFAEFVNASHHYVNATVHKLFRKLTHRLFRRNFGYTLRSVNDVYVKKNISVKDTFRAETKAFYFAEPQSVDFRDPAFLNKANRRILKLTKGLIKEPLKSVDPNMVLMLLNYLYFKGEWKKRHTVPLPLSNDTKVKSVIWCRSRITKYCQNTRYHATLVCLNRNMGTKVPQRNDSLSQLQSEWKDNCTCPNDDQQRKLSCCCRPRAGVWHPTGRLPHNDLKHLRVFHEIQIPNKFVHRELAQSWCICYIFPAAVHRKHQYAHCFAKEDGRHEDLGTGDLSHCCRQMAQKYDKQVNTIFNNSPFVDEISVNAEHFSTRWSFTATHIKLFPASLQDSRGGVASVQIRAKLWPDSKFERDGPHWLVSRQRRLLWDDFWKGCHELCE